MTALMFGLEISSVPVVLPSLERRLGGTFTEIQWIMNAYTIACTTVLMATGTLADRYGRKRLYMISISLFGLTSLACGLAGTITLLIASRFLQGIGGGAMLICQIAVLSHQFQAGKGRAFAFGIWGIVFGAGLGFGPIIGSFIMAVAGWKWIFLVHVFVSALALIVVARGVGESRDTGGKGLNLPGLILLSLAVFAFAFFITQGAELGFTSGTGAAILAAAVGSLLLFYWTEQRTHYPLFDFSVFRIRPFSGALLGSVGMNFSFWPFMIYFPIYFQQGLGYDVVTSGWCLLAYTLPTLLIPPLAERLSLRFQAGVIIPLGMFTIGLGFFWMRYGMGLDTAGWQNILPGALLSGAGLGLTNTPVTNTTTQSLPVEKAGMASGLDMSARLITLAINIAVMGIVIIAGINAHLAAALPGAAQSAELYQLSKKIASGAGLDRSAFPFLPTAGPILKQALIQGFEWVTLYAAVGVTLLATMSYWIFSKGRKELASNP
jgi:EmrB/QacA subfamily drug resistance transporter